MGPLTSAHQRDSVQRYLDIARREQAHRGT